MAKADDITITVRIRGLWRVVLFGWAIKLFRLGPHHVEVITK